jgi:hypothetical protein
MQGFIVPGWMPRKMDNVAIWKAVIGDEMKTDEYFRRPAETQQMFELVYRGLEMQEQQRAMNLAMQSQDAAAQLGQANAAKPQGNIPMPQGPQGLSAEQAAPAASAG